MSNASVAVGFPASESMAQDAKRAKLADEQITVQFETENGETPFPSFMVPVNVSPDDLLVILRAFITDDDEREKPVLFYLSETEITSTLAECMKKHLVNLERTLPITFKPQAIFKVKPVTRCTSSMPGHTQPVVVAQFSHDGRYLASGAGDNTVRFWDISTETPRFECKVHMQYVLALAWAPDATRLASGDKRGAIVIWDPETGLQCGKSLVGHKQFITALSWQPLHLADNGECRKLASASKDGDVRIWDTATGRCLLSMTSHTQSVTCLRWSGADLIYSASQDRTIKVWRAPDGVLCRTLQGHGHWVNVLALNTDYVMRTAAFDPEKSQVVNEKAAMSPMDAKRTADARYKSVLASVKHELMVSGSDDFTLFLWNPSEDKKPMKRMTGHQQLVNDVKFSPDARFIASASFDKSVRLWDGRTGEFIAALRGHVQAVYQLAWSADSRLIVSGSADSTLKLWSARTRKLDVDLPGHGDEIFAVDWSPDGQRVVSAGKDALLRVWRK